MRIIAYTPLHAHEKGLMKYIAKELRVFYKHYKFLSAFITFSGKSFVK